jgi:hypothetical protein
VTHFPPKGSGKKEFRSKVLKGKGYLTEKETEKVDKSSVEE